MTPLSGEQRHELGREGIRLAKRFLESTCRAEVLWEQPVAAAKLQFPKAGASQDSTASSDFFSFDLGGVIRSGPDDGDTFLAEVKKVNQADPQPNQYRDFLAQVYRVLTLPGASHDHFAWITWHPFSLTQWTSLATPEYVIHAIEDDEGRRYTAVADGESTDADVARQVAEQVMVIVLGDRQVEVLTLSDELRETVARSLVSRRSARDA